MWAAYLCHPYRETTGTSGDVVAYDKAFNQSPPSGTVTVTTPRDTSPPTAPVLTGIVRGPSQVRLEWTQSTDDITWWSLGYRVFVNGAPATGM